MREPLSFIYGCGHPQSPATYPPTLDEQPLIVGIHGLATRKAYCQTTLLPLRWALTPPFHPYPDRVVKVAFHTRPGGYFLLHYYTLTSVEPLTRTVLCVARTFLSPQKGAAIERTCYFSVRRGLFTLHTLYILDTQLRSYRTTVVVLNNLVADINGASSTYPLIVCGLLERNGRD